MCKNCKLIYQQHILKPKWQDRFIDINSQNDMYLYMTELQPVTTI